MNNFIITVSREYGSGGRIIGEQIAKELGIAFYNRNLIDMIAHESGLDKNYIENWERQVSSPIIWGFSGSTHHIGGYTSAAMNKAYYFNEDRMYEAQSKITRELAEKESCVIVGRCADYILREHENCLHVMIHADEDSKINRVYDDYCEKGGNLKKLLKTVDKGRASYYNRHTHQTWGDYRNYHLSLDSGILGTEICVSLIVKAIKDKYK